MKLMVWAGYFVAINPGAITVIKASKQQKTRCGDNALFQFFIPQVEAMIQTFKLISETPR
jgi:hypothetical protein